MTENFVVPVVVLTAFAKVISKFALDLPTLQIESYWTYEVCHGKHIRQYHEEKETGQVSVLKGQSNVQVIRITVFREANCVFLHRR